MPKCPKCGEELDLAEYPDTGTSVDCYEGKCKNGHIWGVQIENQTDEVTMTELMPLWVVETWQTS